jgi:hypothetical protein
VAVDFTIRSEKPSLASLSDVLTAIKQTRDTEELATLLLLASVLYGDASCRCEEQAAGYGEEAEEVKSCNRDVAAKREEMLDAFREIVASIKGG